MELDSLHCLYGVENADAGARLWGCKAPIGSRTFDVGMLADYYEMS